MVDEGLQKPKRTMPKGGAKGGTKFPRQKLEDAVGWAKKLVSKTHVEAQPQDVIFAGVVGATSGRGKIRISTLKQYGLMDGDPKGYSSSPLARRIVSAPKDETRKLLQEAFLRPPVFNKVFATFQPDEVSRAKLKQRISELKVHPDEADACADIYMASLEYSGLGRAEGDKIFHEPSGVAVDLPEEGDSDGADQPDLESQDGTNGAENSVRDDPAVDGESRTLTRAVFHVNITLDAAMDADKLEKQLKLLRRYGVG